MREKNRKTDREKGGKADICGRYDPQPTHMIEQDFGRRKHLYRGRYFTQHIYS